MLGPQTRLGSVLLVVGLDFTAFTTDWDKADGRLRTNGRQLIARIKRHMDWWEQRASAVCRAMMVKILEAQFREVRVE